MESGMRKSETGIPRVTRVMDESMKPKSGGGNRGCRWDSGGSGYNT